MKRLIKQSVKLLALLLVALMLTAVFAGCEKTMANADEALSEKYWYGESEGWVLYFHKTGKVDLYSMVNETVYQVKLEGSYTLDGKGNIQMLYPNSQPLDGSYSIANGNMRYVYSDGSISLYTPYDGSQLTLTSVDIFEETDVPMNNQVEVEDYTAGTDRFIKLPSLDGITVPYYDREPTDAELKGYLADFVNQKGLFSPVTDRPAKEGDTVVISYNTFVNETWESSASASGAMAIIGNGNYPEGVEEALIGRTPGDFRIQVEKTFPADYEDSTYAGKTVRFAVVLQYIMEYDEVKLNDPAMTGFDSYEALLESLREEIREAKEGNSVYVRGSAGMQYVLENAEYPAMPNGAVEYYYNEVVRYYQTSAIQMGLTLEQYIEKNFSMDKAAFLDGIRQSCEEMVKQELMVYGLVEQCGLTPDDAAYEAKVLEMFASEGYTSLAEAESQYGADELRYTVYQTLAGEYLATLVTEVK